MTDTLSGAFLSLQASTEVLNEAIEDCALGVATLAIHSVPEVEKRFGVRQANSSYMLFEKLADQYGHLNVGYHPRGGDERPWGLQTHQSAGYPLLLGLKPLSCYGFNIKVYVYETDFAVRPLGCSQGMFASEVFVHRFFVHSTCRTEDPDEADFFFVPVYAACVMTKDGKLAGDMDAFYLDLVQNKLPYYSRKGGRDHLFLWSSETYDFPGWAENVYNSIFLNVEGQPIECTDFDFFSEETAANFSASCKHCKDCFQPWKDFIIPGFVEKWSIDIMSKLNRPHQDRQYLACYHGADSGVMKIYQYANTSVRNELQNLAGSPGTSIGPRMSIVTDYFDRIGQCHFCFVPKGLGYWSNRLYEVMFAGCIPVILSDGIELPFADFVKWESFSVKWPMAEVGSELLLYLDGILAAKPEFVQGLHDAVRANRCWFNYLSEDPECSPYLGILKMLDKRKQAFPRYAGKYWYPHNPNAPV
eukprot:gnl/MRDRNA2_/MRDRNA2_195943_c0_seq1.p1 gnl/MRDRNA2_/MRDRNA2_195943_c0~~gnl/MRDRNA2_/MRDRNA2_195943_c0_seq1.p1  ORF type:complete len:528 (+),score=70.77 gnl/MRDRNA2_/MRDRNA2_195943_c0_seq1:167-1585(+)